MNVSSVCTDQLEAELAEAEVLLGDVVAAIREKVPKVSVDPLMSVAYIAAPYTQLSTGNMEVVQQLTKDSHQSVRVTHACLST